MTYDYYNCVSNVLKQGSSTFSGQGPPNSWGDGPGTPYHLVGRGWMQRHTGYVFASLTATCIKVIAVVDTLTSTEHI